MDGGYDDLGPPTHPNELALDADIGAAGGLDDAADMMDLGGEGGFDGPEFDAPEFNPDMGDLGQVSLRYIQRVCVVACAFGFFVLGCCGWCCCCCWVGAPGDLGGPARVLS